MTTVTITCPMSHRSGWECDGTLTVEVTGRFVPARGFDPPEYPTYEIVKQTCDCDPLVVDGLKLFDDRVAEALEEASPR